MTFILPQAVTSFSDAIEDIVARIEAMQKLCIPGSQVGNYSSFEYPYAHPSWRNVLRPIAPATTQGLGNNEYRFNLPISATLIVGNATDGYEGTLERLLLWTYVPRVLSYFTNGRTLIYERQTPPQKAPTFLEAPGISISYSTGPTLRGSDNQILLGAQFLINVPMTIHLDGRLS